MPPRTSTRRAGPALTLGRGALLGALTPGRALLGAIALSLALAGSAQAEALWRLEQPPPPPGAQFKVPLGPPGDLKFWAPNRGLLSIEGNSTIARGLYYFNGESWRQLSTVCGGPGDTARIAWAGPSEFWVVSEPSRPRTGSGLSLCRFKDGAVAGSYSTAPQSSDPYRQVFSAACNGPNDCWFGGVGAEDPTGERRGAFHLHWDGQNLSTFYAPQGRAVSDIQAFGSGFFESTYVGPAPEDEAAPDLAEPESPKPRLLHRLVGGAFSNDPYTIADQPGTPADGTDLLALDSDGTQVWAGGGGAASGPSKPGAGVVPRLPAVLRYDGTSWREPPLNASQFTTSERIVDIAAVPGTSSAWAAVQPFAERRSVNAKAKVALVAPDGSSTVTRLPVSGAGRGSAARIAFTGPNEGWLVTFAGWLFHYTDGTVLPRDDAPAFAQLITFRPNEAAEQFVPDTPPPDDSQLLAPPPVEVTQQPPAQQPKQIQLPALLKNVRTRLIRKTTLEVSFTLRRKATIELIALRKKKTVGRTGKRRYRPGKVVLTLKLNPKRWPTRLKFQIKDSVATGPTDSAGAGDNVTTTGGGSGPTASAPSAPSTGSGDTVSTRSRR